MVVTSAGKVVDRIVDLEIGADEYVSKPFDPSELLARVKSVRRRAQRDRRGAKSWLRGLRKARPP